MVESTLEEKIAKLSSYTIFTPQEKKVKKEEGEGKPPILFLSGPTACGKTEISIQLAKRINGEIVSADSMQVYQGMNIGTAKATAEQLQMVPHHLIDICDITDSFSVVDYYYAACKACEEIHSRGHTPIVVGGAGFYLHALLYGPPSGPPSVPDLRFKLEMQMEKYGSEKLYQELTEKDPNYAETITLHDRQKIIRALEIIHLTGEPVSNLSWHTRPPSNQTNAHCFFLHRPRPILYKRVEERCHQMVEEGFIEEVEKLEKAGLRENRTASQSIGYRQALEYIDSPRSQADLDRFFHFFKQASRRYVKRQFTWFRNKEPGFQWVDVDAMEREALLEFLISSL